MATITFAKNFAPIIVKNCLNLRTALLQNNVPVGSSCDGEGICNKCIVTVLLGNENLSVENILEQELRKRNSLSENSRVSCQVEIFGDITIDTDYW